MQSERNITALQHTNTLAQSPRPFQHFRDGGRALVNQFVCFTCLRMLMCLCVVVCLCVLLSSRLLCAVRRECMVFICCVVRIMIIGVNVSPLGLERVGRTGDIDVAQCDAIWAGMPRRHQQPQPSVSDVRARSRTHCAAVQMENALEQTTTESITHTHTPECIAHELNITHAHEYELEYCMVFAFCVRVHRTITHSGHQPAGRGRIQARTLARTHAPIKRLPKSNAFRFVYNPAWNMIFKGTLCTTEKNTFRCARSHLRCGATASAPTTAATTAASQQHQHASLSVCVCLCMSVDASPRCWRCAEEAFVMRLCTQVSGRLGGVNLLTLSVCSCGLSAVRLFWK